MNHLTPILFIGHGSPMNAVEENSYTESLADLGKKLTKPDAILCISAHWVSYGTFITGSEEPEQIYDFGGFPKALYEVKYRPPGSPSLAKEIAGLLHEFGVKPTLQWGLDHGTWTVLKHIFPEANIPTLQLSIDANGTYEYFFKLGRKLKELRRKNILIIGSGNVVHNLQTMDFQNRDTLAHNWAREFHEFTREIIESKKFHKIVNFHDIGQAARKSHPSEEHFLPLIYILGASEESETVHWIFDEIHHRSISMLSLAIGHL